AVDAIPDQEGKLTPQPVQALGAEILIEVKCDFAVGLGPEAMAGALELLADRLVSVELAVAHDHGLSVFADDRLIAGSEIDDAQACMTEAHPVIGAEPVTLSVRTAMLQASDRTANLFKVDFCARGVQPDNAT